MLDHRMRRVKHVLLGPISSRVATRVPASVVSGFSVILCVGAGIAAWQHLTPIAVISWLAGRALDGLDGEIARAADSASDRGGYADLLGDTIGYAAVPLGIAFGADDSATWQVVALLLGAFYVNSVAWLMLSTLLEKHTDAAGRATSVAMPSGLVEGTETIAFFTLALAVPSIARSVFVVMAVAVVFSVAQRAIAARRLLAP